VRSQLAAEAHGRLSGAGFTLSTYAARTLTVFQKSDNTRRKPAIMPVSFTVVSSLLLSKEQIDQCQNYHDNNRHFDIREAGVICQKALPFFFFSENIRRECASDDFPLCALVLNRLNGSGIFLVFLFLVFLFLIHRFGF
jgi:hypothetical protein